jgi:hypothetical protein
MAGVIASPAVNFGARPKKCAQDGSHRLAGEQTPLRDQSTGRRRRAAGLGQAPYQSRAAHLMEGRKWVELCPDNKKTRGRVIWDVV